MTVTIQVTRAREAAQAGRALEVMHAVAHLFDASPDRGVLLLVETPEHPDDPLHIAYQVALRRQRLLREAPHDLARQRSRLLPAAHHRREALQEPVGLRGRYPRLILDGVGDPAQQICAGYRGAQRRRQLRDCQRERARHVRQDLLLVGLIGNAGINFHSVFEDIV